MSSWIPAKSESDFSIHNVPFGLISTAQNTKTRPATRIGDTVVDLSSVAQAGLLDGSGLSKEAISTLSESTLAPLAALPVDERRKTRLAIQKLLSGSDKPSNFPQEALTDSKDVKMHLPMPIGDYTDFCISVEHMKNAGRAVAGDPRIPAQMPYMPIGYHGRASSVVPSGVPFKRPLGQFRPSPGAEPIFAATRKLDYEVELAFFVSRTTELGERITAAEAEDAIFGAVLMNDWSARDIQGFEIAPLGPFQGKNFATTISPWVVTLDALKPFEVPLSKRLVPEPEYLHHSTNKAHNMNLSVVIETEEEKIPVADKIRATDYYWSMPQLLVHQTVSGCNVKVGDLIATGTCSGETDDSLGSLVELSRGGSKAWKTPSGKDRTFVEDGDNVIFYGYCEKDGKRVGFGECAGKVLPADKI